MRSGTFDRLLLHWLKPIVDKYTGPHSLDLTPVLTALQILNDFNDTQLREYVRIHSTPMTPLSLKKYSVPYIESKMDHLALFNEKTQGILLAIKAHVELVNQEVDASRFYFEKTFDSSLDSNNRTIVTTNYHQRCVFAADAARYTVDLINKLESQT